MIRIQRTILLVCWKRSHNDTSFALSYVIFYLQEIESSSSSLYFILKKYLYELEETVVVISYLYEIYINMCNYIVELLFHY